MIYNFQNSIKRSSMASLPYLGHSLKSFCIFAICIWASLSAADKKVLLKNVDILTLHQGKMTTGRRLSPMKQLQCISGGSAPCSAFSPRVVQCTNKGTDGYDIQWECKTDMDNAFRFGSVEVSCEGYEYPDDPYILHGSCGLKYSLDYTKEGLNQMGQSHDISWAADYIVYVVIGLAIVLIVYAFYKTCIDRDHAYSSTNDDYPNDGRGSGGYGWFGRGTNPSAPRSTGCNDNDSCQSESDRASGSTNNDYPNDGRGSGGYGWFGGGGTNPSAPRSTESNDNDSFRNRNSCGTNKSTPRSTGCDDNDSCRNRNSGAASNSAGDNTANNSTGNSSSGTRTASGFGGTSRR